MPGIDGRTLVGDRSAIGWCDTTWNPTRGCRRISPGCARCYAEVQADRIVRMGKGAPTAYDGLVHRVGGEPRWTGLSRFVDDKLAAPLHWRKPRRIFVDSMSDLFYEGFEDEEIAAVFGVMAAAPQHTFQVLTKRSERMLAWFSWLRGPSEDTFTMRQRGIASAPNTSRALLDAAYERLGKPSKPSLDAAWKRLEDDPWPLPNVWLGVSVEDREHGLPRIDDLRAVPATTRFLSCEPLLEDLGELDLTGIGWVITGCESGDGARPADVAWFDTIARQCTAAAVPLFNKQMVVDGKIRHDVVHFPATLARQEFP